jgi:hypothetical protein
LFDFNEHSQKVFALEVINSRAYLVINRERGADHSFIPGLGFPRKHQLKSTGATMMNTMKIAPVALVLALGFQFAPAGASADTGTNYKPFSFQAVENMRASARAPAVQDFLAQELPVGAPISQAVARLQQAHANCGHPGAAGAIRCEYSGFGGASAGGFSEVTWTVTLSHNDQGVLTGTTVNQARTGFAGN